MSSQLSICTVRRVSATAGCTREATTNLLVGYLRRLAELRHIYGREREPFETHVISPHAYTADGVRMLEDLGVTDVIVGFRDPYHMPDTPLPEKIDYLRRYAATTLAALCLAVLAAMRPAEDRTL